MFVYTEFTKRRFLETYVSSSMSGAPPSWQTKKGQSLCDIRLEERSTKTLLLRSCSCVETLAILQAKFYVVSSLLCVIKIAILMLASECPCTPLKISLPENENTVNHKCASFVVIMLILRHARASSLSTREVGCVGGLAASC